MSTTSNVTGNNALAALAAQLFKGVDADSDGKLSAGEFQSFLEGLLNKVGGVQTAALAPAPALGTPASAPRGYQAMIGFDFAKLNNPDHTTPKYVFARATQDIPFGFDRASRSVGLQQIAEYAKTHGYPDTTVIGDDTMNFGDGYGEIDVLTGDGQWWWGPKGF
jgi:hypothetical protein